MGFKMMFRVTLERRDFVQMLLMHVFSLKTCSDSSVIHKR